jgi:hypothetical protein
MEIPSSAAGQARQLCLTYTIVCFLELFFSNSFSRSNVLTMRMPFKLFVEEGALHEICICLFPLPGLCIHHLCVYTLVKAGSVSYKDVIGTETRFFFCPVRSRPTSFPSRPHFDCRVFPSHVTKFMLLLANFPSPFRLFIMTIIV